MIPVLILIGVGLVGAGLLVDDKKKPALPGKPLKDVTPPKPKPKPKETPPADDEPSAGDPPADDAKT